MTLALFINIGPLFWSCETSFKKKSSEMTIKNFSAFKL